MKPSEFLLLLIPTFILTACVSMTAVTPAGKDTYLLAGDDAWEASSGFSIKTKLYQKADSYCESIGKKFMPLSDSSVGYSAQLRFRCLDEGDPELSRPDLQPVPDVRIEHRQ